MDVVEIGRYIGALLLVLGLVAFAGFGARRFSLPGLVKPAAQRRLKLIETLMITPRQRLCIVKCDDVEHLVMIGEGGANVVEKNIAAPAPAVPQEPAR
jgi:flagellar protein FliO/FliZ